DLANSGLTWPDRTALRVPPTPPGGLPLSAPFVRRTLRIQACPYAHVASIAELEAARWAGSPAQGLTWLVLGVKRGGMVKTRFGRWVGRWRERRLVREQTRQASAARQAKRAAESGRSHPLGHGGSGGG